MFKVLDFFQKLLQNNTGVSSKSFFLVSVTMIGLLLLLVPVFVLVYEVIQSHTIHTDLNGMAAYIAAVAGVFASAGITQSEKSEKSAESIN